MPWPESGRVGIFYGARACAALSRLPGLSAVQNFFPYMAGLPAGCSQPRAYDYALALLPKQGEAARGMIAEAWLGLKAGGVFAFAADNDAGGNRLAGWMKQAGITATILPKHHARVVFGVKDKGKEDVLLAWCRESAPQDILIGGELFRTQPGLFAWDHADAGSRLLLEYLPSTLSGIGADFGCGYGWLARQVIRKNTAIDKFYLLDADRRAVDAALCNLSGCPVQGIWIDLTQQVNALPKFDFIVMNPPFHEEKREAAPIGQAFIKTAACSLKSGGVLWMVSNRHLPYEAILTTQFSRVINVEQNNTFKIFNAIR